MASGNMLVLGNGQIIFWIPADQKPMLFYRKSFSFDRTTTPNNTAAMAGTAPMRRRNNPPSSLSDSVTIGAQVSCDFAEPFGRFLTMFSGKSNRRRHSIGLDERFMRELLDCLF
jgi:hypothetical protein